MSEIPTVRVDELPAYATLVDVREVDEWDAGHAEGALHVPATEFLTRYGEIPPDDEVHIICRTGGRSARVTEWLNQNGFDAVNVAGGMDAWVEAGRPIVSETGAEPHVK
jgi:rhodanese-related sulfurtransferase